jgi:nicotinamidase-related amidase
MDPVTDPAAAALLVLHHQNGLVRPEGVFAFSGSAAQVEKHSAKDVKRLFLAGIATNWIVESTTRYGAELGYDITVLADCCQGFSDELHDFAIAKTLPYYATIVQSTEFIAALPLVSAT